MSKLQLQKYIENDELDLSLQNLTDVPVKDITKFTKLRSIDLSCNVLENITSDVGLLVKITKLDLSKNKITTLPEEIGQMVNLEYLDLRDNKLVNLPISMCNLKRLKWLDLKGNPLSDNLKNAAGDCLDKLKCSKCAENVLACLETMKIKKQKGDEKRKLKEMEILKQKEKDDKELRDKKRIEKSKERVSKRKLEEEKLAQMKHEIKTNEQNHNNDNVEGSDDNSVYVTGEGSNVLWRLLTVTLLLVLLMGGVMSVLMACNHSITEHNEQTRRWCRTINGHLPPFVISVRDCLWRYVEKYALNV